MNGEGGLTALFFPHTQHHLYYEADSRCAYAPMILSPGTAEARRKNRRAYVVKKGSGTTEPQRKGK
ncbi:MAG: hypothetical protein CMO01_16015 [Thalassobius sp.]|nr:hypothetical protein [Thalassovita sp.]